MNRNNTIAYETHTVGRLQIAEDSNAYLNFFVPMHIGHV